MNAAERNEKIELYGHGFNMLVAVLKDIPREMWQFKPAPTEWSIHEVIIHLADSETNAALRARMLIVEPGGTLMGYDQDAWANTLNYHEQDLQDALEILHFARKTTYELLKKQPDEVFEHIAIHPEYKEPYTFDNWLDIYSAHIPGHIEQIMNNYKIWKDTQA
ncbi:MAG TPA: DinB family protein [Anaerolineales bacterium]|nr:DinB family protein [Anaerolineales bacterium]